MTVQVPPAGEPRPSQHHVTAGSVEKSAHVNSSTNRPNLPGDPSELASQQDPQPAAPARQRGQWSAGCGDHLPNPALIEPGDEEWLTLQAERASRIVVLGRIRAHLETEPSPRAVRATARRWGRYITAMGEDVVTAMDEAKEAK